MTTQQNQYASNLASDENEIDLGRLLALLLEAKCFILFVIFLFIAGGIAIAFLSTPIYKADALIQLENKNSGGIGSLVGDLGELFIPQSSAMTEMEIIKSRMILGNTVDKFNLTIVVQPKYTPFVGKGWARLIGKTNQIKVTRFSPPQDAQTSPHTLVVLDAKQQTYQLLKDEQVVLEGKAGELAKNNSYALFVSELISYDGQEFIISLRNQLAAIEWLKNNLSLSELGNQSGILRLSFIGEDSKQISEILNHISQTYFLQNVARNSAEAEKSLVFLNEQLPSIRDNLTVAENNLNLFRQKSESVDLGLEAQATLDVMVKLESQLSDLTFQESEISQRFTKDHPTYKSLLTKRQALLRDRGRLERQIQKLPKTQREVLRLTRDVEVNQQIYIQLLNKVQELGIIKAGTIGNVRILDEAQSFTSAIKPRKALIVTLAALFGGIVGILIIMIKNTLNPGIKNSDEIEKIGLPVYAHVPKSQVQLDLSDKLLRRNPNSRLTLLAETHPADLSIEALRSLRTSLHFAMTEPENKNNKVLMISGPSPGMGKTFVSINFSAVAVKTGQRILLIDGDMRKGYLEKCFGYNEKNGLSDLLGGSISLEQAVQPTQVENLDIITRGQTPPNPSELLMHPRFNKVIEWASDNYDLVIIDTPPVLAVTDASIIGALAGTTLLVARFGGTTVKELEIARSRLAQSGISVKGVIFNAIERNASSSYKYYNYSYK